MTTPPDIAPAGPDSDAVLSPADVCRLIPGMTIDNLAQKRHRGDGPVFCKTGRVIVYLESDVRAWLHAQRMIRTDQAA